MLPVVLRENRMKSDSLPVRAAKVALWCGLALGANASDFHPRVEWGGRSSPAIKSSIVSGPAYSEDEGSQLAGSSIYSILAGLGFMGAIVLRRKSAK
jgi:hypothetical protein